MIARLDSGAERQGPQRWRNVFVAVLVAAGSSTIRAHATTSRLDVTVTVVRSCSIRVGSDNRVNGPVTVICAKESSVVPLLALSGSPSIAGQQKWVAQSGWPEDSVWRQTPRILMNDLSHRADGPPALFALGSDPAAPRVIIDF